MGMFQQFDLKDKEQSYCSISQAALSFMQVQDSERVVVR